MEHTATRTSKNRVSRFAVMIADFCNKIGTPATSQRDPVRSGHGGNVLQNYFHDQNEQY
jgi:hypothetical protein